MTAAIVAVYLLSMLGLALWCGRGGNKDSHYFLNDKSTGLWMMTFSTSASFFGAGAFVATVAEIYNTGISFGVTMLIVNVVGITVLGICATRIREMADKTGTLSFSDFMVHRFGPKAARLFSAVQLLILFLWSGIQAVAMAAVMHGVFETSYEAALFFSAFATIAYTSVGGLKADILSDAAQLFIMIVVFSLMTVFAAEETGSLQNIVQSLPPAHMDLFNFGGVPFLVGSVVMGGLVVLGNAAQWQRAFAARTPQIAKKSFFYSIPIVAFLCLITLYLGLSSAMLLPEGLNKEDAVFVLMKRLLPDGLTAFGVIAILAVIMSTIDSLIITGGAILSSALKKKDSPVRSRFFKRGPVLSALFGTSSFLLAYVFPHIVELMIIVGTIASCFVPAMVAGLYGKKTSEKAAFWSLAAGLILLAVSYPLIGKNSFLLCVPFSTAVILFYDRVKRRLAKAAL